MCAFYALCSVPSLESLLSRGHSSLTIISSLVSVMHGMVLLNSEFSKLMSWRMDSVICLSLVHISYDRGLDIMRCWNSKQDLMLLEPNSNSSQLRMLDV